MDPRFDSRAYDDWGTTTNATHNTAPGFSFYSQLLNGILCVRSGWARGSLCFYFGREKKEHLTFIVTFEHFFNGGLVRRPCPCLFSQSHHIIIRISSSSQHYNTTILGKMPEWLNIPILKIQGHKLPVPAYREIVHLSRRGLSAENIIKHAMQKMRNRNRKAISVIVFAVIEDQQYVSAPYSVASGAWERVRLSKVGERDARTVLAHFQQLEKQLAKEAAALIGARQAYVEDASTAPRAKTRQRSVERNVKEILEKRQNAEDRTVVAMDILVSRQRLLAAAEYELSQANLTM